jgi:hypothetical protein
LTRFFERLILAKPITPQSKKEGSMPDEPTKREVPTVREVDIPQYLRVFGEMAASKSTITKELMPAVSRILTEVPKWVEQAQTELRQGGTTKPK